MCCIDKNPTNSTERDVEQLLSQQSPDMNVHVSINSPVLFSFSYAVNVSNCAEEQLLVPDMFEEKNLTNSLLYFHSVQSVKYKLDLM